VPGNNAGYLNGDFISFMSVVVESLFSESQYCFGDRRLFTTPEHVEQQMFLRANRSYWNRDIVRRIFRRLEAANRERAQQRRQPPFFPLANANPANVPANNNNTHPPVPNHNGIMDID
jgi:hypothetical protein